MIIEDIVELEESSGYSLSGSFTPDLVFSKLWLIRQLSKIQPKIDTMYVLGSWYGNLALLIDKSQYIQVNTVINVETTPAFLKTGQNLLKQHQVHNTIPMLQDANKLDYRRLNKNSAVVNTSLTDMNGTAWFDNIPSGTLVALQARDHDAGNKFTGPLDIQKKFPLQKVLYSGKLNLEDPETKYSRFMVIGIK
jgi:hypothetical protein